MNYQILTYGLNSIFAQTFIIREVILNFGSSEFFLSFVFCGWFISIAIGLVLKNLIRTSKEKEGFVFFYHITAPVIILFSLLMIKKIKIVLTPLGGEIDILHVIILAVFSSFIYNLLNGLYYPVISQMNDFKPDYVKTYYLETVGYIIGSLLLFISFKFDISLIKYITALYILNTVYFLFKSRKAFATITLLIPLIFYLNHKYYTGKHPVKETIFSTDSEYGKITVNKIMGSNEIFIEKNGAVVAKEKDDYYIEKNLYFPLLLSDSPSNILIIDSNFTTAQSLLTKFKNLNIDIIETDRKLINTEKKYFTIDEKINIITEDPFNYLSSKRNYDVIFLNYDIPEDMYSNKFFTVEFFNLVKTNLSEKGIFTFKISYTNTNPSRQLLKIKDVIINSLKENFNYIYPYLDEDILVISSINPLNEKDIYRKIRNRKKDFSYLTKQFIDYIISTKDEKILKTFSSEKNKIFVPKLFLYKNIHELSKYHYELSKILYRYHKHITFFAAIIIILYLIIFHSNNCLNNLFITSFSFISVEFLIIFLYQIKFGYIYRDITLLVATALAGLSTGAVLAYYLNIQFKTVHILLILLVLPVYFIQNKFILFTILFAAGLLNGITYANTVYYRDNSKKDPTISYLVDILTPAMASILIPLFFIPVLGVKTSIIYLIVINLFAAITTRKY